MAYDKVVDSTQLDGYFGDIATAIRGKNGSSDTYTPSQMPAAITAIPTGQADERTKQILTRSNMKGKTLDLTDITDSAFVTLPAYAFSEWALLAHCKLPEQLTTIGASAFYNDINCILDKLPDSLKYIYDYAFYKCIYLTLTQLPSGLLTIENGAFEECKRLALTSIPSTLLNIGDRAFLNCSAISFTTLPDTITSIGQYAFKGCTALALTNLPAQLTTIPYCGFVNCENLALNTLPETVTEIATEAFSGCTKLAITALPKNLQRIGSNAFYNCPIKITEIPATVTSLGTNAFYNTAIEELDILPTALKMNSNSQYFGSCEQLKKVKIRCKQIGLTTTGGTGYAFQNDTALEHVWIASSCTLAGRQLFDGCTSLEDIYCEATSKPSAWSNFWNYVTSTKEITVHWGVSEEEFDEIVAAQATA